MQTVHLKRVIDSLPNEQHLQCWQGIEAIDKALGEAGATALLCMDYVRALHEERVHNLLVSQRARISQLEGVNIVHCKTIDEFREELKKTFAKVAKLKKKSKA